MENKETILDDCLRQLEHWYKTRLSSKDRGAYINKIETFIEPDQYKAFYLFLTNPPKNKMPKGKLKLEFIKLITEMFNLRLSKHRPATDLPSHLKEQCPFHLCSNSPYSGGRGWIEIEVLDPEQLTKKANNQGHFGAYQREKGQVRLTDCPCKHCGHLNIDKNWDPKKAQEGYLIQIREEFGVRVTKEHLEATRNWIDSETGQGHERQ